MAARRRCRGVGPARPGPRCRRHVCPSGQGGAHIRSRRTRTRGAQGRRTSRRSSPRRPQFAAAGFNPQEYRFRFMANRRKIREKPMRILFLTSAHNSLSQRTLGNLPGPRGLPLLGNIHQLDLSKLHLILERWAAQYGPVYLFKMGSVRVVALSDPRWCDQVLRARPETFTRHSGIAPVASEMGVDGVFSAEGDAWRPQRRLAMLALAQNHLRGLYPKLQTATTRLKKRWERLADAGAPLDVVDELKRFTVDVTTLITFGHDVNTVEQGNDVIQRKLALVLPAANRRLFALFPTWKLVRCPRDRRLDRALAEVRAWLGELVGAERARLAAEPGRAEQPSNFLEAMLSARDDDGRPFSDDVIFGNLMTMLLAGEDTTADTLGWAVHQLCDSSESVMELRRGGGE